MEAKGLRIGSVAERGRPIRFRFGERWVDAFEGETVATALWAAGIRHLRSSPRLGGARGAFCLMGVCQECVVVIDGHRRPSCASFVAEGLVVEPVAEP